MAGIVERQMKPAQAAQPAAKPPVAGKPAAKPQANADPVVTRVVIAGKKILANPEIAKRIIGMMKAAGDPAAAIAQALVFLMKQIFSASQGMPPKAIVPAAQQLIGDVARLGTAAGLFKATPEIVKQAALQAIKMFLEQAKQMGVQQAQPAAQPQADVQQPAAEVAAPDQMMGA